MSEDLGLRERKRLSAMRRIQTAALDLFEQHGFDEVTIERIAEVSEVSPSSVYRYFGTEEALVIWDEYDPAALAAVARRSRHPGVRARLRGWAARCAPSLARQRLHHGRAGHRRAAAAGARARPPARLNQGRETLGRQAPPRWPPRETDMASKDKGGKASKTAAALTPKEKKQAKRDKKAVKSNSTKDL